MNSDPSDPGTRREFIHNLIGGLAGIGVASALGEAGYAAERAQPGVLAVVSIEQHGELKRLGGFVTVKSTPAGDLIVIRSGESEYTALSVVCPHAQCSIKVKNPSLIQCPCHQSGYKTDGSYISGPAKRGLRKFPVQIEGSTITVLMD